MSLWPACPVTVSQRRVAIEVAGLAVWAEALPETKRADEQVPFSLSTPASAGRRIMVPSARIFPSAYILSLTLILNLSTLSTGGRSGHGGQDGRGNISDIYFQIGL